MCSISFTTEDDIVYEQCNKCIHIKCDIGEYTQLGANGVYSFMDNAEDSDKEWFTFRTRELLEKVYYFFEEHGV